MKVLLDTQALIYFMTDDPALTPTARTIVMDTQNQILVSVATCWEMAIKASKRSDSSKDWIRIKGTVKELLSIAFDEYQFQMLPISFDHATRVEHLPMHHKDPFDRLLVAQCLVEGIPIASNDAQFDAYSISRIW